METAKMWKRTSSRHCSDEALLEYLDGELSVRASARVSAHLDACWQCRAQLAEIEAAVMQLVRETANSKFPSRERIEKSKQDFLLWKENFERNPQPAIRVTAPNVQPKRLQWWGIASAAALVLCVGGMPALYRSWRAANPTSPKVLLSEVAQAETNSYDQPGLAYQQLELEIEQLAPVRHSAHRKLEVWSDTSVHRLAISASDETGKLNFSLWRPTVERQSFLDGLQSLNVPSQTRPTIREINLASQLDAFTVDEVERQLTEWLRTRPAKPIVLSEDALMFTNQDGVTVSLEHGRDSRTIRLRAVKRSHRFVQELRLEWEAGSKQVRVEQISLQDGNRSILVRLRAVKSEHYARNSAIAAAVFEPPYMSRKPRIDETAPAQRGPVSKYTPTQVDVLADEIELLYLLHRKRACLGEGIDVTRFEHGLEVRGIVSSRERKSDMIAGIATLRLSSPPLIKLMLAEEAAQTGRTGGPNGPVTTITARAARISPHIEQLLANNSGSRLDGASREKVVTEYVNRIVAEADHMLAEAWALRRLADNFKGVSIAATRPQAQWFLELMIRDHVSSVRAELAQLRITLGPLLSGTQSLGESEQPELVDWTKGVDLLITSVRNLDNAVQILFAASVEQSGSGVATLQNLSVALSESTHVVKALEIVVARDFAGDPNRAATQ